MRHIVIIFIKIKNLVVTTASTYLIKHIIRIDVLLIKSKTILSLEKKKRKFNTILKVTQCSQIS